MFGGTSVAAPTLAGIINSAGNNTDSPTELSLLYSNVSNSGGTINPLNFFDIQAGAAGNFSAKSGWDFVTGIGTTYGMGGK